MVLCSTPTVNFCIVCLSSVLALNNCITITITIVPDTSSNIMVYLGAHLAPSIQQY